MDYPVDDWEQVINVNLNGRSTAAAPIVPHMLKHGYGRIVNIASIAGKEGNPNASPIPPPKRG